MTIILDTVLCLFTWSQRILSGSLKECWNPHLISKENGAWRYDIICPNEGCAVLGCSVLSEPLQPRGLGPARLLCPQGFSRQEHWSGLPFPSPRDLPNPGMEPRSPTLQADSLPAKPKRTVMPKVKVLVTQLCPTSASLVAQSVKNLPAVQETWVPSLGREDPLEKETAAHSSILACKISWT